MFCDRKGVLLVEFIPEEKPSMCYDTMRLRENVDMQFKVRSRGILSEGMLLHKSALLHVPAHTQTLNQYFGWEQFSQSTAHIWHC